MKDYTLPYKDDLGFCNIKMSALGGDGANMAGKMIFDMGVNYLNIDGAYDAKYGSEKKGTPTDVSVKLCKLGTSVRTSGPTDIPHILGIFHTNLIETLKLYKGLQENATVIVNTTASPDEIRDILKLHSGVIVCIDAINIAAKNGSRVNMPMLAGVIKALKFPKDTVLNVIKKTWPKVAEKNEKAFSDTEASMVVKTFKADGKYKLVPGTFEPTPIGYLNQKPGAYIENASYSSIVRKHHNSRSGFIPVWHQDVCIHCTKCFYTCADPGSIIFKNSKMQGINYEYCKGCLRCVSVCPETKKGKALTKELEKNYLNLTGSK